MTRSQFDDIAATFDDNPVRAALGRAVGAAMVEALRLDGSMTVLDYGAGTGLVSAVLAPHCGKVICADTSSEMLAVLGGKIASSGLAKLVPAPWSFDQPWPVGLPRPDAVVGSMVLHHVEDVEAAARAFFELLPGGGQLAMADLDEEDGSFHAQGMQAWHNGFSRAGLGKVFEKAGFDTVRFTDAHIVFKPGPDGAARGYPVFLMTARKP